MIRCAALSLALLAPALLVACDDDHRVTSPVCRADPAHCDGLVGAICDDDRDCNAGFCCRDNGNCGPGMCTYRCDGDRDCPPGTLCQHGLCFYACDSDRDCAPTMSCEHGNTVCEYP